MRKRPTDINEYRYSRSNGASGQSGGEFTKLLTEGTGGQGSNDPDGYLTGPDIEGFEECDHFDRIADSLGEISDMGEEPIKSDPKKVSLLRLYMDKATGLLITELPEHNMDGKPIEHKIDYVLPKRKVWDDEVYVRRTRTIDGDTVYVFSPIRTILLKLGKYLRTAK